MLSNNQLKFIRSLHQAKYRKQHRLFLAEGPKLVSELTKSPYRVKTILATESWFQHTSQTKSPNLETITITRKELERISTQRSPNEVVAVVEMKDNDPKEAIPDNDLILVLDGIRDPGNLGTILRTADWFGFRYVICSNDSVDLYNPKVVQASMGSISRVRVIYQDLISLLQKEKKTIVYGALLTGENLFKSALLSKGYLVIGNESHGISAELIPYITHPVSIPSVSGSSGGGAESLNASGAAAIFCAEFRRQSFFREPYEGSEPS